MKLKTLAWSQISIGVLIVVFFLIRSLATDLSPAEMGRAFGASIELLLIALFAILTGLYNLKQK